MATFERHVSMVFVSPFWSEYLPSEVVVVQEGSFVDASVDVSMYFGPRRVLLFVVLLRAHLIIASCC